MKKKWVIIIIIACVVVLAVLCIPRRYIIEDGGSIDYEAILYRVICHHGMLGQETDENGDVWFYIGQERVKAKLGEWWEFGGTEVQILGFTVYDNTGLRKIVDAPDAQSAQTALPTAGTTPEGNPYFTCTGTEYGPYPIIPYTQREAEAKTFLTENRELLERAAADWPDRAHFSISDGEARAWNEQKGGYEPVDAAATLPESLQALVRLSEEYDVDFYVCDPDPVFLQDASSYFKVSLPMAIDETMYTDPGTLYYVALIYTTNTEEQITDSYRHDVKPLDGNWFLETYFYAY